MINRRTFLSLSALALARPAWASTKWPDRPIRLVVPFPAGGGVDSTGRIYSAAMSDLLGWQVVVENRSGASGAIGAQAVAKAAPDGYTFLLSSPAEVMVSEIAGQKLMYDPGQDLLPVALAGETPLGIVAHPSVPVENLQELLALGKEKAAGISYGTPGNGSTMHFAGEALKGATGLQWQHVPYKGAAPAINDLLGGQIEYAIAGLPPLVGHIKGGKLKALAVTSSSRSDALPDVMAVSELPELKDFRFTNWMGVFAPRGTPAEIVDRFGGAFESVAKEPAVIERLKQAGLDPSGIRGEAFTRFLAEERQRYEAVARTTKLMLS